MKRHLQHAVNAGDSGLAGVLDSPELRELGSAGTHNELADPLSGVRLPTRVQRGEAFVEVFMTV
jgi:hypothetical protein